MRIPNDGEVAGLLAWPAVLDALEAAFTEPQRFRAPPRVALDAPEDGSYLTMPCADDEGWFGVKQVSVLPRNPTRGLSSVHAWYTLFGPDGRPALACDARTLTRRRTAGVSAVAARRLAPERARTLLIVGSGSLAPSMAWAHLQVRPYERVLVWGRDAARAEACATRILAGLGGPVRPAVRAVPDLQAAAFEADVISVATTSSEPLVRGAWLGAHQHLDLVGAFRPGMAEADVDAVWRCDVFVDDLEAARHEAGDLLAAAEHGWGWESVRGELRDLVAGDATRGAAPTLFKSVGLAFEDLVVARLLAAGP